MQDPEEHPGDPALDERDRNLQEFVRELTAAQGRIHAFLISLMPGSPDVADVLQETNLTIWKSRERYQPGTNFLAWAFTIAKLEVLHQHDRAKRLGRILLSPELTEVLADEMPHDVMHKDYLQALESCMTKLTDGQRDIIEARYQTGHSLEIHARLTGRNPGALRIALLRIRETLRECVEKSVKTSLA
jgi:RNA polymerase sigma-70 factor (ECF subfamily)